MADPNINNSGNLIVQVPPREEEDLEVEVEDTGAAAVTAMSAAGAGAVTAMTMGGTGGAVNTAGAGAVTSASELAVTTAGAGALTMSDRAVTCSGGLAVNSAGAGAVTTGSSAAVNTAGAGAVTNSGGTIAGEVNTTGAGSVSITGFGGMATTTDAKGHHLEEKLPWMVGLLGGLADGAAAAAALYKSPGGVVAHGGELVYGLGLATVFAAGLAEMLAAFWVSRDTRKRGETGKKILYVSILTLLLGMALVGAAISLKHS